MLKSDKVLKKQQLAIHKKQKVSNFVISHLDKWIQEKLLQKQIA